MTIASNGSISAAPNDRSSGQPAAACVDEPHVADHAVVLLVRVTGYHERSRHPRERVGVALGN
jgi:hypothetical protein